jgi:MerR family copper efflux transcriptional regulator
MLRGDDVRIGELARRTGLTVHTLRFYERKGLLALAPRGPSNYREFPSRSVERLKFIQEAQRLGFTLAEIRELLGVSAMNCDALRTRAERKLLEIEGQIRRLQAVKGTLRKLLHSCNAPSPTAGCATARSIETLRR